MRSLSTSVLDELRQRRDAAIVEMTEDADHWTREACGQDSQEAEESGALMGRVEALAEAVQLLEASVPPKSFDVTWSILLDADDQESAARAALEIMRDPASTALVFSVRPCNDDGAPTGDRRTVDLS